MSGQAISSEQATTTLTLEASQRTGQMTSKPGQEITTSASLARRRAEGKPLTIQKLEELKARVLALEKIA